MRGKVKAGKTYKGDPNQNTSYYSYGKEILAIESGKVVAMLDGIPNSLPPGNPTNSVNLPLYEAIGNHIIIWDSVRTHQRMENRRKLRENRCPHSPSYGSSISLFFHFLYDSILIWLN